MRFHCSRHTIVLYSTSTSSSASCQISRKNLLEFSQNQKKNRERTHTQSTKRNMTLTTAITKDAPATEEGRCSNRSSKKISSDVDTAVDGYKVLQGKLRSLITAMTQQHASMMEWQKCRLMTTVEFEAFVSDSPLSAVVGNIDLKIAQLTPPPTDNMTAKKQEEGSLSDRSFDDESKVKLTPSGSNADERKIEDENQSEDVKVEAKSEKHEDVDADDNISFEAGVNAAVAPDPVVGADMESVVTDVSKSYTDGEEKESDREDVDKGEPGEKPKIAPIDKPSEQSYAAVQHLALERWKLYADMYTNMIEYVQLWLNVVSSRIDSGLLQFEALRRSLVHYEQKVQGLEEHATKVAAAKLRHMSPKQTEKLKRNELKLQGAREAHDSLGESLFLLIDETTTRAWRDFFPLLLKAIQFDVRYSADEANILSDLEKACDKLQQIGSEENIDVEGRLQDLKEMHAEEFYTGDRTLVRSVAATSYRRKSGGSASTDSSLEQHVQEARVVDADHSSVQVSASA